MAEDFLHYLCSALIAGALVFGLNANVIRLESGEHALMKKRPALRPLHLFWYVLIGLVALTVLALFARGGKAQAETALMTILFKSILPVSLYYSILMLLLPFLRRRISAIICAILWLIPALLVAELIFALMRLGRPKLVLRIGPNILPVLLILWGLGAAAVILRSILQHRRLWKSLSEGLHAPAPEVTELWLAEQRNMNIPEEELVPLHISEKISTPITIGLMRGNMNVLLPGREYSRQELRLIFRHELVHIRRDDTKTKLFIMLYTAVCWFNPLMWSAMKRCSEDLELSCDEQVLYHEEAGMRELYGKLLLQNAAAVPGFNTCLSASAKSLKYRLQQIMPARKKVEGAIVAGILMFLLFAVSSQVALAWDEAPASRIEELQTMGTEQSELHMIQVGTELGLSLSGHENSDGFKEMTCRDEAALAEYLSGFTVYRMTGDYRLPLESRSRVLELDFFDEGWTEVYFYDHWLICLRNNAATNYREIKTVFYRKEPLDWEYLDSMLDPASKK